MTMTEYCVERMHFGGDGLARDAAGRWVHIANALEGERVLGEDVSIRRRRQALCGEVLSPSPLRVAPCCPHGLQCPACQYQCVDIEAQRRMKFANWRALMEKFVTLPDKVECWNGVQTLGYRHRTDAVIYGEGASRVVGIAPRLDVVASYIRRGARAQGDDSFALSELDGVEVLRRAPELYVPLRDCALHAPELNALIARVEAGPRLPISTRVGLEARGDAARIVVYATPEAAEDTRRVAVEMARDASICVVFQCLPPRGSHVYPPAETLSSTPWYGYMIDSAGHRLDALKGAWTPVNPPNAVLIPKALASMMSGLAVESMIELGCGCGTHSSLFLEHARHFVGIDASWPSILSAQHNAAQYHWDNASFFTDTAEHYLDKRYYKGARAQAIVMHSNRMPYSLETAKRCLRFGARDVFIVAPTAFAMAQECRHFVDNGCQLVHLTLCDTLPMTYHQMAVAHLVR